MMPVTACCFLLCAAALLSLRENSRRPWMLLFSKVSGITVSTIGLLTFASYLFLHSYGDEWPLVHFPLFNLFLTSPTRMAVITACLFSILGIVVLLQGTFNKLAANISHALLIPAAMMSYLVLVGYLFHVPALYNLFDKSVAINTGVAFCALCVAALFCRPDTWLMSVFTGAEAGANMARRLLPALLTLPLVIGWFRIQGEQYEIFSSEVGVSLVATAYTICFVFLVWLNARAVNEHRPVPPQGRGAILGERSAF